uniref:EF-hand domain-containing protein n=1 Tax=Kalanchoe fedtschenkoi TaxID=63787 RepID=A0A7N0TLJ9_KALFE
MVSRNDPGEALFSPLNAFKTMFSPLELGIRKAANDFECCWSGTVNGNRHTDCSSQKNGGLQIFTIRKKNAASVHDDEKVKGLSFKVPVEAFAEMVLPRCGNYRHNTSKVSKKSSKERNTIPQEQSCKNCMNLAMTWSVLIASFFQTFSSTFKVTKKKCQKMNHKNGTFPCSHSTPDASTQSSVAKKNDSKYWSVSGIQDDDVNQKDGKHFLCLIGLVVEQVAHNFQMPDQCVQRITQQSSADKSNPQKDHFKIVSNIIKGRKSEVNGFLRNFNFARVGGVPSSMVEVDSVKDEGDEGGSAVKEENTTTNPPPKQANRIFDIPLSNVERLRSTLSTVSLSELIELVPQLGRSSQDYPDKKKLFSVQDFFRYTESEGRRFFEELDRDGDGQVTLEDLETAMRKRKLPQRYARDLMRRTRSHLFCKSFGWKQFLSFMEQKEPTILRAYTSLCLSKSGTLQKSEVLASLKNAGLPSNEDNAVAMMRFLNADTEESISYGHFRNFMLLLPSDRLQDDPRNIWFEAATVVAVPPPVNIPAGSVLKSALAGGLASALSTSILHPVDTIKTRVQASTLSFPEIIAKLPEIGRRGLYRGSIPAIIGQFSSHGLRTGICEASRLLLISVAPSLPEFQVQSVSSFCGTFLGTAVRIPCEVLKQRLQAGIFDNVGEAIVGTWSVDGLRGFFRGTGATLCREVPFYVVGMGLYGESKKAAQKLLGRELEPWETILVGALSGGVASVATTPFDVMKTRMMTAPGGRRISMSMIAFSILRREGPLGLFKGAIPRFFWIAPLGAMNFAGYELARKAMDKEREEQPAAAR